MAEVNPADLVFVDESGVTTRMRPHYGRAPRGERVIDSVPHGQGKGLTVLGALTRDGVLATMTIDCATDAAVFGAYGGEVLCPRLRAGQVVVMGNLPAHKGAAVRQQIEAVGCRLVYLPPYSPDLNPSEPAWSQGRPGCARRNSGRRPTWNKAWARLWTPSPNRMRVGSSATQGTPYSRLRTVLAGVKRSR